MIIMSAVILFKKDVKEKLKKLFDKFSEEYSYEWASEEKEDLLSTLYYLDNIYHILDLSSYIEYEINSVKDFKEIIEETLEDLSTFENKRYEDLIYEMENKLGKEFVFIFEKCVESWKPFSIIATVLVSPLENNDIFRENLLPFYILSESDNNEDRISLKELIKFLEEEKKKK